jgi:hypothetical protein
MHNFREFVYHLQKTASAHSDVVPVVARLNVDGLRLAVPYPHQVYGRKILGRLQPGHVGRWVNGDM